MAAVLEVHGIAAAYGDVQALWDVSFTVEEGQVATLLGSNGAGKTTTLRVISGLMPALEGEVLLHGERLSGLSPHRIVERGVIQVPEGRHLWPNMSVEDNLVLGAYGTRSRADRAETLGTVYALFPRLAERRAQLAGTLSGGEQQMAAIGRGLMGKPQVLMLDEPSLGLAPILVDEVFRVVSDIVARGVTVLLVEQNVHRALEVASMASVIENGRVVLSKSASEMASDPSVRSAYLGL
ncbi:MAG TPA: ABC transporter ATP-binding protein [Candidatus Limnocylindria bacterium]|nr:ABC transporter ATP-binding protein [Candidatus Limnocylindria bacterium]